MILVQNRLGPSKRWLLSPRLFSPLEGFPQGLRWSLFSTCVICFELVLMYCFHGHDLQIHTGLDLSPKLQFQILSTLVLYASISWKDPGCGMSLPQPHSCFSVSKFSFRSPNDEEQVLSMWKPGEKKHHSFKKGRDWKMGQDSNDLCFQLSKFLERLLCCK